MDIHILAPEIASQIAAGEVVERPASVIKELLENSLDSGAHSISINILEAGRVLMEVVDDGCGIPADQLELALARHATSKLSQASDLFSISTLGFRGEALASIGSVSRLTIISRTNDAEVGARLQVEAGISGSVEPVATPPGTQVRVQDLFFNVPARLKFLKTDSTERRTVDTLVTRYALAYPHVRIKLMEGNVPKLQTSGDGDQRAILAALYGVEVARQMLEVIAEEAGIKLKGFISPTSITRSNRREITFFINGRWVQDTPLTAALNNAYHTLLMVARYPLAALFMEIDPADVDVNVHPAKAEVRFRNQDRIFSFVQRAARRALLAYAPIPSLSPQVLWGSSVPQSRSVEPAWNFSQGGTLLSTDKMASNGEAEVTSSPVSLPGSEVPLLRLVGQIGSTYLVAEGPDGLYLIDQHAAHERVLFEKLMTQYEKKSIPSQTLMTPISVQLTPAQASLIEEQLPILAHFGFHVEPFGPGIFQVRALPVLFAHGDPAAALHALVEDFEEDESPLQNEIEARLAGRVCKRLAVKAGQVLSPEEQRSLLDDLEACNSPRTCPHGRPTMIHLPVDLLERQFGRKGAR
ncbi:MAG: DNA mismatch repair endonuclease MutL [Chloroflexota bacterium]